MPSRKAGTASVARTWQRPCSGQVYSARPYAIALGIFTADALLYVVSVVGTFVTNAAIYKLGFSLCAGLGIALLFLVGHDACHGSLTPLRTLNHFLGRMAFLPSLHSFSLWELGHNKTHHVYTNLRGKDYVFAPLSRSEFDALTQLARIRERFYRSVWGHWWYYCYEIWWKKMVFPRRSVTGPPRVQHYWDGILLMTFGMIQLWLVVHLSARYNRPCWEGVFYASALPFLWWNVLMAFVIWQQHTHPLVPWFNDLSEWRDSNPQVVCTVHIVPPRWLDVLFHNIFQHTAHHVNVRLPFYNLRHPQCELETGSHKGPTVQLLSLRSYLDSVKRCKLYDYERYQWLDFEGKTTSSILRKQRDIARSSRSMGFCQN